MTASTQAINLKDKRSHFLLIPSSTYYFGISFLIVALTRPWNYLFWSERGQSCASINCENCHLFITIALLVYSKCIRFTNEGLSSGNYSDTRKNLSKNKHFGDVGVNHSQYAQLAFLCTSRSQPTRYGRCPSILSLCPGSSQGAEYSCSTSPSVTKVPAAFKMLY